MIDRYFTQDFEIFNKVRANVQGVVKETLTSAGTFKGILDKAPTAYRYAYDRETFDFTDILFTGINILITEDSIIVHDTKKYDVISVIDNLYRGSHLECLLKRAE